MKAIIVREFGAPEVLRLEEVGDLKPNENQVLVRVKAAGVNPVDTIRGHYAQKPNGHTRGKDAAESSKPSAKMFKFYKGTEFTRRFGSGLMPNLLCARRVRSSTARKRFVCAGREFSCLTRPVCACSKGEAAGAKWFDSRRVGRLGSQPSMGDKCRRESSARKL